MNIIEPAVMVKAANLTLSKGRAASVKTALVARGIGQAVGHWLWKRTSVESEMTNGNRPFIGRLPK